ncbi:MAG: hypothetical protein U5K38_02690 [Woeseiaceae bacterium]|nr:hypothetical protein [Woeseiaceae bacterium]
MRSDGREYWTTPKDVWTLFQILVEERRRREIDPTLSLLRESLMAEPESADDRYAQQRLQAMHDLIEQLSNWTDEMSRLPPRTLVRLLRMGRRIDKAAIFRAASNRLPNPEGVPTWTP